MSLMRAIPSLCVLCFLIAASAGCETTRDLSSAEYLAHSHTAIERQDWDAAYRLMEDALVSSEDGQRNEAYALVDEYPQIRDAARQSFSVKSLEETYRKHGERAFEIEANRLSVYQHSIATPKDYEEAIKHFHTTYDPGIRAAQVRKEAAQEEGASQKAFRIQHDPDFALDEEIYEIVYKGVQPRVTGNIDEMLEFLKVGQVSRRDVLAKLGKPSRHFELATILTWFIRVDGDAYTVVPTQHGTGVTHSLVLVFSREGTLSEKSFVKIVR
jgi:hypothetical protein